MIDDPNRLVVTPLTATAARVTYPLIQAVDSTISLTEWLRYARGVVGGSPSRRGVLLARRPHQSHPCGAVCWLTARVARPSAVLVAEHLTALDTVRPDLVLVTLVDALLDLATELHCSAVRAVVPETGRIVMETLRSRGLQHEGAMFAKPLDARRERRRSGVASG